MQQTMSMQDTQYNCQHQSVSDFLHYCYLDQYVEIFLSEGFESVNSVCQSFFCSFFIEAHYLFFC
jgi:hypothetical protein